jgi:cardiolipin synthase C
MTRTLATLLAGSASSLHSKVFATDSERVFIGPFNFDPRSTRLNTEMGLLIESPTIAAAVTLAVEQVIARDAYAVRLTAAGTLEWMSLAADGTETVHATEPNTTWFDRSLVRIIGILPFEWMM